MIMIHVTFENLKYFYMYAVFYLISNEKANGYRYTYPMYQYIPVLFYLL